MEGNTPAKFPTTASSTCHVRSLRCPVSTPIYSRIFLANRYGDVHRRAQLRWCFERLKEVVPCPSGRHTTKGLLASASHLVKVCTTLISPVIWAFCVYWECVHTAYVYVEYIMVYTEFMVLHSKVSCQSVVFRVFWKRRFKPGVIVWCSRMCETTWRLKVRYKTEVKPVSDFKKRLSVEFWSLKIGTPCSYTVSFSLCY